LKEATKDGLKRSEKYVLVVFITRTWHTHTHTQFEGQLYNPVS